MSRDQCGQFFLHERSTIRYAGAMKDLTAAYFVSGPILLLTLGRTIGALHFRLERHFEDIRDFEDSPLHMRRRVGELSSWNKCHSSLISVVEDIHFVLIPYRKC